MAGKRKIIIYVLGLAAALAVYLALAHFFIFYRVKTAELEVLKPRDSYIIGGEEIMTKNLLYAALGDSLTAGAGASKYEEAYPYLLAQALADKKPYQVELKNFSYPGAKTSDLINDLLAPAAAARPDLVTLLIGTNDVFSGVSRTAFKKNYQTILERLTKETTSKIYLIGLPHLGSPAWLLKPYNGYFYFKTWRFNKVIRELAAAYDLKYIDLAALTGAEFKKNQSYYSKDFFHPSALGYKFWARIIYDDIN